MRSRLAVFSTFFAALVLGLFGIIAVSHSIRMSDDGRVERIRTAVAKCQDPTRCMGGFLVHRFSSRIDRIDSCGTTMCRDRQIDLTELRLMVLAQPNEILQVVLPDDSKWEATAVAYERQFVVPKELRP